MTRRILDAIDRWLDGEPWPPAHALLIACFMGTLPLLWAFMIWVAIRWLW